MEKNKISELDANTQEVMEALDAIESKGEISGDIKEKIDQIRDAISKNLSSTGLIGQIRFILNPEKICQGKPYASEADTFYFLRTKSGFMAKRKADDQQLFSGKGMGGVTDILTYGTKNYIYKK